MAEIVVICGVVCFCSSSLAAIFAFPIPETKDPKDGFTEVASGRAVYDNNGDAFTSGLTTVCALNCDADFTCNSYSTWTQSGKVWCLKSKDKINPWLTIPQYIVNKTDSKIYVKNS